MHMRTSDNGISCRSLGIIIVIPPLLLPHVILRFTALCVSYFVILGLLVEVYWQPSSFNQLLRTGSYKVFSLSFWLFVYYLVYNPFSQLILWILQSSCKDYIMSTIAIDIQFWISPLSYNFSKESVDTWGNWYPLNVMITSDSGPHDGDHNLITKGVCLEHSLSCALAGDL